MSSIDTQSSPQRDEPALSSPPQELEPHDQLPQELDELVTRLLRFSGAQKRLVLCRLMRDLYGDDPCEERTICNPDRTVYGYFLPQKVRLALRETPALLAELQARIKSPGPRVLFKDVVARLRSLET